MKFDAFLDLDFSSHDMKKPMTVGFDGDRLFYNESDGSSFPNGGTRQTHGAAAFNSWDKTSPPFIWGDTLYLPACFVAFNGCSLDFKTPLLRSHDAIKKQGKRLLTHLGEKNVKSVYSNLGWEQEFHVIDVEAYNARPDLRSCGRTLIGSLPERHQNGDMNYFAAMPCRVKPLMEEISRECRRIGIPLTCFHNEVAPAQHEFSPIFSMSNIAVDQNQIVFEMAEKIAAKHKLVILWHEKPFAKINGNGKHNNWSIQSQDDKGDVKQWFVSGSDAKSQEHFITFIAALAYAMNHHGDVIRCTIATAGNDHRLGAQEAPPGIMSLYTGVGVEEQIDKIIAGADLAGYDPGQRYLEFGTSQCQKVKSLTEDRNRTAPLPYSGGNRFEFRAVGSSQNCAFPVAILNTAYADGLCHISDQLDKGKSLKQVVAQVLKENRRAIFNGNGYGEEWPKEAARRGLLNLKNTPMALKHWTNQKNLRLFEKHKIFTQDETWGRAEIQYEQYINHVSIECETLLRMVDQGIAPALVKDLKTYEGSPLGNGNRNTLYANVFKATETLRAAFAGLSNAQEANTSPAKGEVDETDFDGLDASESERAEPSGRPPNSARYPDRSDELKQYRAEADHLCYLVLPKMLELRELVDEAELKCDKTLWPYPTYNDMLFGHHMDNPVGPMGAQPAIAASEQPR